MQLSPVPAGNRMAWADMDFDDEQVNATASSTIQPKGTHLPLTMTTWCTGGSPDEQASTCDGGSKDGGSSSPDVNAESDDLGNYAWKEHILMNNLQPEAGGNTKKKLHNKPMPRLKITEIPQVQANQWQNATPYALGERPNESGYAYDAPSPFVSIASFEEPPFAQATEPDTLDVNTGAWSSIGAALHSIGKCKPCLLYRTPIGCRNGESCAFCHFDHCSGPRASKSKRERIKRLVEGQLATANAWYSQ